MRRNGQVSLRTVPCNITVANAFIDRIHRHHGPVPMAPGGYRYCIAVIDPEGEVRGVATIALPVGANRMAGGDLIAEVSRVATDGCSNACSALYGAAARSAKALGYTRIITYILDTESGTSVKAAGWRRDAGWFGGQTWKNHPRAGKDGHPVGPKARWGKDLNPAIDVRWPEVEGELTLPLFAALESA